MEQAARKSAKTRNHSQSAMNAQASTGTVPPRQARSLQGLLRSGRIQAKLTIGQPNDHYERQADAVANKVLAMSDTDVLRRAHSPAMRTMRIQRRCAECHSGDERGEMLRAKRAMQPGRAGPAGHVDAGVESRISGLRGRGEALDDGARSFFEPRFGQDFSRVRIHRDRHAASLARAVDARAFTLGNDIVFGAGEYRPQSREGKRLLGHELTHVVQQGTGLRRDTIQRRSGCTNAQDHTIDADHARARGMLTRAIAAVHAYDGQNPAKVHNALARHFDGATGSAFAGWINVNLGYLWGVTWSAGYECYTGGLFERQWACGPDTLATTFWCVPNIDIRLCPSYFSQTATGRSTTLIHEWVHKFGCNFDLGYEHEAGYSKNRTITQLLNADSFANFVRDVQ